MSGIRPLPEPVAGARLSIMEACQRANAWSNAPWLLRLVLILCLGSFALAFVAGITCAFVAATADAFWHDKSLYAYVGAPFLVAWWSFAAGAVVVALVTPKMSLVLRIFLCAFFGSDLIMALTPWLPEELGPPALFVAVAVHQVFFAACLVYVIASVRKYWRTYVSPPSTRDG
jgi:hypothetical protein